jgi:hypothetical protein
MFGQSVYWRETMKPARFLIFDGRVVLVLIPAVMHFRVWTLILALITMMVFWYFDRKGVPTNSILRFARAKLIGRKRTARGVFEERTAIDFGFESAPYLARMKADEAIELAKIPGNQKKGILAKLGLGKKTPAIVIKDVAPAQVKLTLEKDASNG